MYYYFSEVVGVSRRKISLKVLENEEAGTQTVIYGIILLYLRDIQLKATDRHGIIG